MDKTRFGCLKHNVAALKNAYKKEAVNPQLEYEDYKTLIKTLTQEAVYANPPWGGASGKDMQQQELHMYRQRDKHISDTVAYEHDESFWGVDIMNTLLARNLVLKTDNKPELQTKVSETTAGTGEM